jgi:hypothetical protein
MNNTNQRIQRMTDGMSLKIRNLESNKMICCLVVMKMKKRRNLKLLIFLTRKINMHSNQLINRKGLAYLMTMIIFLELDKLSKQHKRLHLHQAAIFSEVISMI